MQSAGKCPALLVRACWDIDLRIAPAQPAGAQGRPPVAPVLERPPDGAAALHLPPRQSPGAVDPVPSAAAMHAAAHLRFSPAQLDHSGLKPLQQVLFGVLEDARVEALSLRQLPGLRGLWLPFHLREAAQGNTVDALLRRLARALAEPRGGDGHPWVDKARRLFALALRAASTDDQLSALRQAASLLGNDLGQMRLQFNAAAHLPFPCYRDDNAHLWHTDDGTPEDAPLLQSAQAQSETGEATHQGLRSHDEAQGAASSSSRPAQARDDARTCEPGGEARPIATVDEWDRLSMRYRSGWCQIFEHTPPPGDARALALALQASGRWRVLAAAMLQAAGARRRTAAAALDGDDIATDPMVASAVALRARQAPERRLYRAAAPRRPALEVVLVLDTSVSTGAPVALRGSAAPLPLLDAMKTAAMLACAALEDAGYLCSLTGFCSNTRQHVRLQPVKSACETIAAPAVLSRLAGLRPQWSTRTGAALRHLAGAPGAGTARRLLVLLTDGEPHDIDIHDPAYLEDDLRRAIREAQMLGSVVLRIGLGKPGRPDRSALHLHAPGEIAAALAGVIAAQAM